jgi:hypothetical protein
MEPKSQLSILRIEPPIGAANKGEIDGNEQTDR